MMPRGAGRSGTVVLVVASLAVGCASGCGSGPDATYGRSRDESLNGTGVLAALFRARGHEVRTARRLTGELDAWADVIVRFAPRPGPPLLAEASWYNDWLGHDPGRSMVYIPRDYDARAEYWGGVLERLPPGAPAAERSHAEKLRDEAQRWPGSLPAPAKEVAGPEEWFAVDVPKVNTAVVCKVLGGPWARGIDPAQATLPRHQTLKVLSETVLLTGDSLPLAIEWTRQNESRVLVVASGAFLLNAPLVNPARRLLAMRVVDWVDAPARKVAFVEGQSVVGAAAGPRSVFDLLRVQPFGWVAAQMLALGLAGCLARAPRLGRARGAPPSDTERPAAHAEAIGALLARTRQSDPAKAALDTFRQWRRKPAGASLVE
jgi:hypothetical protein